MIIDRHTIKIFDDCNILVTVSELHASISIADRKKPNGFVTVMGFSHQGDSEFLKKQAHKFLDTSESPRFLPRFKYGTIHLGRKKSRSIYDQLKNIFTPIEELRENNIDELLKD